MALALKKSRISEARVKDTYEKRCQAHIAVIGRNPTSEQREKFKNDVANLAKRINADRGVK